MMSYGTLMLFLSLIGKIQSPIIGLARTVPTMSAVFVSVARIMEINGINEESYDRTDIRADACGIRFDGVDFAYGGENVFTGLNVDIAPGSLAAVTGASGIGKTTFIRLMMNFIDAQKGSVTYSYTEGDGKAVEIKAAPGIRDYISYVPQGNTLFSGTIKENLLIGNKTLTKEEIDVTLKTVELYTFVNSLPDGAETRIGEKGHGLSEGQAQRVAIARALVKKAPIIIFDEATSALDEKTELKIIENIKRLENKPTCIIITHRREIIPLLDEEINLEK